MRIFFYRAVIIFLATHLTLNLCAFPSGFCQERENGFRYEYGLSLLGGMGDDRGLEFDYYAVYPRWGWLFHDRWAFELEGNIGHYRFDSLDTTSFGLHGLFTYEVLQSDRGSGFIAAGGGLLHLDVDERPRLTDATILGLVQVGFGAKLPIGKRSALRLEYRFQHISDPFDTSDTGLNYHNLVLGFSFMRR